METQIAAFPSHVPIRTLVIRGNRFGATSPLVSASCEAALTTVFASPAPAGRFQPLEPGPMSRLAPTCVLAGLLLLLLARTPPAQGGGVQGAGQQQRWRARWCISSNLAGERKGTPPQVFKSEVNARGAEEGWSSGTLV